MAGSVKVLGLRETLTILKSMDAEYAKVFAKEVNKAVGTVRTTARGYVPAESPMSGWAANADQSGSWAAKAWDSANVKRRIVATQPRRRNNSGGFTYERAVENKSAPGMIYELAGSKSYGNDRRGARFIFNIAETGLRIPLRRLVVRAGIEAGPAARESIAKAIDAANERIEGRLKRVH